MRLNAAVARQGICSPSWSSANTAGSQSALRQGAKRPQGRGLASDSVVTYDIDERAPGEASPQLEVSLLLVQKRHAYIFACRRRLTSEIRPIYVAGSCAQLFVSDQPLRLG